MTQIAQIQGEITPIKEKIAEIGPVKNFSRPADRDPLTERIIACCYKVHTELGSGFNEKVYHNALKITLEEAGLKYETEKEYKIVYKSKRVGSLRLDLVIEDSVIVEIKALACRLPELFKYQVISYLKVSTLKIGLLINFGSGSCEIKRLSN